MKPEEFEINDEELRSLWEKSEEHDVPFKWLGVDRFHSESPLREAVAQFFDPSEGGLASIFYMSVQQGKYRPELTIPDMSDVTVRADIILTYPLTNPWKWRVEFPASRLGEIFSLAHDMYLHIYDLDNANWQAKGHQDKVPRGAPKLLNRARGEYVWGHDMSDLVFEGLAFAPNPEWPKTKRKKLRMIMMNELPRDEDGKIKIPDPEYVECLVPLEHETHKGQENFIGTFMFQIGS